MTQDFASAKAVQRRSARSRRRPFIQLPFPIISREVPLLDSGGDRHLVCPFQFSCSSVHEIHYNPQPPAPSSRCRRFCSLLFTDWTRRLIPQNELVGSSSLQPASSILVASSVFCTEFSATLRAISNYGLLAHL